MRTLVTGSCGLVGHEASVRFATKGQVVGIDNDTRGEIFGVMGSTSKNVPQNITQINSDFCDMKVLRTIFSDGFDCVIHCAAQPSHELSLLNPRFDFQTNVVGTFNLLEITRELCPDAIFVFISTNKVYGDSVNSMPMTETTTRYELHCGIKENQSLDCSTHGIFGASKASADLLVQEYNRSFNMKTVCFRCGCITGERQKGVMLHGFLSYLGDSIKHCRPYTILGYKGKQLRDNIHVSDLVSAIEKFVEHPKPGIYNMGGGLSNSCSVLEGLEAFAKITKNKPVVLQREWPRLGDHIAYHTDFSKFQSDYPSWSLNVSLEEIFERLI